MRKARKLLVGVAIAALFATGCEWHLETLDGPGSTRPGHTNNNVGYQSAPIIYNGNPHVFYKDSNNESLRHAYWNGVFWAFETLDGTGSVLPGHSEADTGWQPSVILYNGRPHVFYHDEDADSLRHAYWNGVFWAFETLDGNGGPNGRTTNDAGSYSASMLYNGRPHIFYWESDDRTLRHAYYSGVAWAFETLDGNGGANGRTTNGVGLQPSVILYNGRPHVFYADQTDNALRHAWFGGSAWAFETLDGNGGANGRTAHNVGRYPSVVPYNGRPHVFYYDQSDDSLRHAWFGGSAWGFETLDGTGSTRPGHTNNGVGQWAAATVYGSQPHVFYQDTDLGLLRRAYWTARTWKFLIIDGSASTLPGHTNDFAGGNASAVTSGGRIYVFYLRTDFSTTSMRHAWFG